MSIAIIVQTHQELYGSLKGVNCLVTNYNYPGNVATDNSVSFKYKSSVLGKPAAADNNGLLKDAKNSYSSKIRFLGSLEMLLINRKIDLELSWT